MCWVIYTEMLVQLFFIVTIIILIRKISLSAWTKLTLILCTENTKKRNAILLLKSKKMGNFHLGRTWGGQYICLENSVGVVISLHFENQRYMILCCMMKLILFWNPRMDWMNWTNLFGNCINHREKCDTNISEILHNMRWIFLL